MGMAASQARFLGLTARRSNVEFEGQQINQQRTALSNQSANYYNDLLGMSVPVPPSVEDFTKTVYTFEDGVMTNEITSMIAQQDGTYKISYLSKWQDDYVPVAAATNVINVQEANGAKTYYVGATALRDLAYNYKYDDAGNIVPNEVGAAAFDTLPAEQQALIKEELAFGEQLKEKYGVAQDGWSIRYVTNKDTGEDIPYFYKEADIEKAEKQKDENGNILSNINCYTIGSDTKTREVKSVPDVKVERDSSGRFVAINIPNTDGTTYSEYALTTSTITDQAAYDDAMNAYEHEKYLYDQAIQEINAKIEVVQAEDKNLELRLKQLDTEHNAIQTEIDAVSKVIQKNTESSFKTFG